MAEFEEAKVVADPEVEVRGASRLVNPAPLSRKMRRTPLIVVVAPHRHVRASSSSSSSQRSSLVRCLLGAACDERSQLFVSLASSLVLTERTAVSKVICSSICVLGSTPTKLSL